MAAVDCSAMNSKDEEQEQDMILFFFFSLMVEQTEKGPLKVKA